MLESTVVLVMGSSADGDGPRLSVRAIRRRFLPGWGGQNSRSLTIPGCGQG